MTRRITNSPRMNEVAEPKQIQCSIVDVQMLSEGRGHRFQNYLQLCSALTLQPTAWRHHGQSGKSGAVGDSPWSGLPAPRGSGLPHDRQDARVDRCNKRCLWPRLLEVQRSCVDTVSSNWQLAAPLVMYVSE